MINPKVLSMTAALALVLAMPSASFAQIPGKGGGAGARGGGAPAAGFSGGGGMRGGAVAASPRFSGGGGFAAGPRFSGAAASPNYGAWKGGGGVAVAGPTYSGRLATASPGYGGGGNWQGGNWRYRHHHRGGFWPGVAVGAAIGGSYAYYGGPGYYDPSYYDDGYYYDDSTVAAVPVEDDAASCAQRYRSYDPASGTYLGYDGQRHPCP